VDAELINLIPDGCWPCGEVAYEYCNSTSSVL